MTARERMFIRYRLGALSAVTLFTATTSAFAGARVAAKSTEADSKYFVEYLLAKCTEFGWGYIALWIIAALIMGVLLTWGVSKLIDRQTGTLRNTFRYFGWSLAAGLGIGIIESILEAIATAMGSHGLVIAIGFIASLAAMGLTVAIPMKVYDIGFLRALGFLLLYYAANITATIVLIMAVPGPLDEIKGKSPEEMRKVVDRWRATKRDEELMAQTQTPTAGTVTPESSEPDLAVKVQQLHAELQQARAQLDTNDQAAVVTFNQRVAEYNTLKARLAPAPAATTSAPTQRKNGKGKD